MEVCVFTIVAKNYLPYARVLMNSVQEFAPESRRVVLLVDRVEGYFNPDEENFEVIYAEDLNIPDLKWLLFKYTILELSTALKPWALEFLFRNFGFEQVVYLDPDIRLYGSLRTLSQLLKQYSIVLTPHLTESLDDGAHPDDLDILRAGSYNLGFIALSKSAVTFEFLIWWQSKLYDHCVVDVAKGLFVDQRWIDLVPGLFPNVMILRDPGYNTAYWNVKHRRIRHVQGTFRVHGRPLIFFHFSGFNPLNPEELSRHQNRFVLSQLPEAMPLVLDYGNELIAQQYSECREWPYSYSSFDNGVRIPDLGRPVHRESPEICRIVKNPFSDEGFSAFQEVWNGPAGDAVQHAGVTRLARRMHSTRSDVQQAMPDLFGNDRIRFLEWFLASGRREHSIADEFCAPVENALSAARQAEAEARQAAADARRAEAEARQAQAEAAAAEATAAARVAAEAMFRAQLSWLAALPRHLLDSAVDQCRELEDLNSVIPTGEPFQWTTLAQVIYQDRTDLQRYAPDPCGKDAARLLAWLDTYGRQEYRMHSDALEPLLAQWNTVMRSQGSGVERLKSSLLRSLLGMGLGIRNAIRRGPPLPASSVNGKSGAHCAPAITNGASAHRFEVAVHSQNGQKHVPAELGVNLVGYLNAETGVGQSARLAMMAASTAGLPLCIRTVHAPSAQANTDSFGPESPDHPYPVNLVHVNADETPVVMRELGPRGLSGRYNIGYWAWELEEFPERWQGSFQYFQEVWTPSQFCQDTISRVSPIPVLRMPHCVRIVPPEHVSRTAFGLPTDVLLFATMFDCLSISERKNALAVVRAFVRAFGTETDKHLVVKISHSASDPDYIARLRDAASGYAITFLEQTLTREDTNALLNCCDCFVSLHRSEGFGLTLAEAMSLGKPVITTAYSGNMDFTNAQNSFLVAYRMVPVPNGCAPYDPGQLWAEPSVEEAAQTMRLLAESPEIRSARGKAGQQFVENYLSPEAVGLRMRARLASVTTLSLKPLPSLMGLP